MKLYTGQIEGGGELLLTEHDDGTRDIAYRPDPHSTWGPPVVFGEVSA